MQQTTPTVDWALVRSAFNSFRASSQEHAEEPIPELDAVLRGDVPALNESVEKARAYAVRLGASAAAAPHGHAFVNGKHFDLDDVRWGPAWCCSETDELTSSVFAELLAVDADGAPRAAGVCPRTGPCKLPPH